MKRQIRRVIPQNASLDAIREIRREMSDRLGYPSKLEKHTDHLGGKWREVVVTVTS